MAPNGGNAPTPALFRTLKKEEMVQAMKEHGTNLRTNANKPVLIQRYTDWYNLANPSASTAGGASATTAGEASASATAQEPEESGEGSTAPPTVQRDYLFMLLKPANTPVSAITKECIKDLQYTQGVSYTRKPYEADLSNVLGSMKDFTTFFLASLAEVQLVIGKGENLSELQSRLSDHLRGVANAPKVLATYYEQWGIEVFQTSSRKSSPPRYEVELETQIAMAMQASIATASGQQHEVAGGPEDDAKLEAALQEEVDIFSDAIRHRLARWKATFPQKRPEDRLWSSDFTKAEQKSLRKMVTDYLDEHEALWEQKVSTENQVEAVETMHHSAPEGISASVIQAIFLDVRTKRHGYLRRSESTASSRATSRTTSPVKQVSPSKDSSPEKTRSKNKRARGDEDEEEDKDDEELEDEDPVNPAKRMRTMRGGDSIGASTRSRLSGSRKTRMDVVQTVEPTDEEDE